MSASHRGVRASVLRDHLGSRGALVRKMLKATNAVIPKSSGCGLRRKKRQRQHRNEEASIILRRPVARGKDTPRRQGAISHTVIDVHRTV